MMQRFFAYGGDTTFLLLLALAGLSAWRAGGTVHAFFKMYFLRSVRCLFFSEGVLSG